MDSRFKEIKHLRVLIEHSSDGMVVLDNDDSLKVYEANPKFAQMLGYTPEELQQLHPWDWDAQLTREQILSMARQSVSGDSLLFETRHRRKDGTIYDAEVSASAGGFDDRILIFCVTRDISARKAAEAALRESQAKFAKAFHLIPDAVYITDFETGKYIEINEGFERMTGYRREEAIGNSALGLNLWANPSGRKEMLERFRRDGFIRNYLGRFRHREGREVWGELSAELIEINGRQCALYITRDVSERLRAENERRRLETQVHQAQKLDSLGSLAGGVAHDMNNVLGAILGLASAHIERQPRDSPLGEALDTIAKACLRGRTMVRGLLDFSRPHLAEKRLLDLNAIVLDQIKLLERTTLQRIRFEADLEPSLGTVMGDSGALSHLLMNLCVNAVDAMPEGGILTIRTRNLGNERVELTVADTGCGMSPEVLQKALDPFFTTKPLGKGSGLGLSIVYGTVMAHHGQIEIQSEPGLGTRVLITFPAHKAPAAEEQNAGSLPAIQSVSLRVLVVDDDDLVRVAVEAQLEHLGHSIAVASSGEAALERLEQGLEVDAVILDVNMPGLGGEQTLPRLRRLRPDLPVFLATGRADQSACNLAERFSGVFVLAKPFSLQELRAQLGTRVNLVKNDDPACGGGGG